MTVMGNLNCVQTQNFLIRNLVVTSGLEGDSMPTVVLQRIYLQLFDEVHV